MSLKKYKLTYDYCYDIVFKVDTEKFTEDMAKYLLEFFTWDYDDEDDLITEYMKKLAVECLSLATFEGWNVLGVIDQFENKEGFPNLDGSEGITLLEVEGYEFKIDDDIKITDWEEKE